MSTMEKSNSKLSPYFIFLLLGLILLIPVLAQCEEDQTTPALKDIVSEDGIENNASSTNEKQKKLIKVGPSDEFNRGVPRNSFAGYFRSVKSDNLKLAAEYLDLRNLPKGFKVSDGSELARQLKVILDRALWVEMDLLSIEPEGHSDDGLPSYRDLVGQIKANNKTYDILVQRVPRKDGIFIWKISSKTVGEIPELYRVFGYGEIGEKLSQYFPGYEFMGLQLWQWVFLLLIFVAILIALFPIVRIIAWFVRRRMTDFSLMVSQFINGPVYLVLSMIILRQNFGLVHPSLTAKAFFEAGTLIIVVFIWVLIRSINLFREFYSSKLSNQGKDNAVVLLGPALTSLKIIILFLGFLVWLDNIGFSVTTVLAGLGVGGIAIALATQKSIENFIGAITLYLAAPVKVGDFCRFSNTMGVIEEIGLRGTKIRTLENTVVNVPNSEFAAMQIENLTDRKFYRFSPVIHLHFKTSPAQIRLVLDNIRKSLSEYPKIIDSPFRVSFRGFGEYSLDIEIHCYIDTVDINEYKAIVEEINLHIMDVIQSAGVSIAIPATLEYHKQETADATDLKQEAELQVNKFRARHQ